jgi:hypothetical protein
MPPKPKFDITQGGRYTTTGKLVCVNKYVVTFYDEPWCSTGIPWTELPDGVEYICGQAEYNKTLDPETLELRQHFQGCVVFVEPQTIDNARRLCGVTKTKFIPMGNQNCKKAIGYTKKDDTAVLDEDGHSNWSSLGRISAHNCTSGDRSVEVFEMIKAGASFQAICEFDPSYVLRSHGGVDRIMMAFQQPPERPRVDIYVLGGITNVGKSHAIFKMFEDMHNVYTRPEGKKWWSGYERQIAVLFDEFHPKDWNIRELLRLFDKWPLWLEPKNRMTPAYYERVYISTNIPFEQWFLKEREDPEQAENYLALVRRIPPENRVTAVARVPEDVVITSFKEYRDYQLQIAGAPPAAPAPAMIPVDQMKEMMKILAEQILAQMGGKRHPREGEVDGPVVPARID